MLTGAMIAVRCSRGGVDVCMGCRQGLHSPPHLPAPHQDLVFIGGNFDKARAWRGCKGGTPMLRVRPHGSFVALLSDRVQGMEPHHAAECSHPLVCRGI